MFALSKFGKEVSTLTELVVLKFFKRLDFVVDQDYFDLVDGIAQERHFYKGEFPLIDHRSPQEVSWAISKEVPTSIKYSFWNEETQVLEFPNIFVCSREGMKYVFRLDTRHQLNEILQEKMPNIRHYRLNCVQNVDDRLSYNFYLITTENLLTQLFQLFYAWLDAITEDNLDD
jgi:hypothetical protein